MLTSPSRGRISSNDQPGGTVRMQGSHCALGTACAMMSTPRRTVPGWLVQLGSRPASSAS